VPDTLALTLAQSGIFCAGWLIVAALMPQERGAALCWFAYAVLEGAALGDAVAGGPGAAEGIDFDDPAGRMKTGAKFVGGGQRRRQNRCNQFSRVETRLAGSGRQQVLRLDQDGDPAAYRRASAELAALARRSMDRRSLQIR